MSKENSSEINRGFIPPLVVFKRYLSHVLSILLSSTWSLFLVFLAEFPLTWNTQEFIS